MKKIFQKGKFYDDFVREVMLEVYEEKGKGLKNITKQDYAKAIVKKFKNCSQEEEKKLLEDIRPSVSRAIDRLVISGEMVRHFEGKKNYYFPSTVSTRDFIVNKVIFSRRDIDVMSDSVCLLFIENLYHETASNLLEEYIGEDCCTITELNNAILLCIKYRDDNFDDPFEYNHERERNVIRELAKIVRESYDLKHPKEIIDKENKTTETKK